MKRKKIISILVLSVILCSAITKYADAATGIPKIFGRDLVDSGGHMDYTVNTKYSTYVSGAASIWNNYLGYTVIREKSWNTIMDCDIYNVSVPGVTWFGLTAVSGNDIVPGYMEINTYRMDQVSGTTKLALVFKHEFGHTLGCDENDSSDLNIMYPWLVLSNINLTINDKASVDLARQIW
jgi:hypothetical protein